ncbi:glycosyltransferase family 28 C-terminal domain-containing protein [Triangularia verruculosa]|uniref:UDP-N-acetylglucosamine transferase subunit ALG13 n=1 Tax=Triangularia verruculosa TaxID=2587418 RepID=A0AAN6XAN7_9PEZI|nr:glycosyltransferase family 28 C-terminal domain-containing protein [Triangularia verruculosa]
MDSSTPKAGSPPSPAFVEIILPTDEGDSHHQIPPPQSNHEQLKEPSTPSHIAQPSSDNDKELPTPITNTGATCPDSDKGNDNVQGPNLDTSDPPSATNPAPQMASPDVAPVLEGRHCFVTIGSIASFLPLLEQVISRPFLTRLQVAGFKKLTVQCGPNVDWFEAQLEGLRPWEVLGDLEVEYFSYAPDLKRFMLECRGEKDKRLAGCVIAHAGAGTVLEVKRYGAPLIVVPNPTLMDNHQLDLAVEVQRQGWAIHGKIDNLPHAVDKILQLIQKGRLDHLPRYKPPPFPVPEAKRFKLFDWMVLTCYPEEFERKKHLLELQALGGEQTQRRNTTDRAADGSTVDVSDAARMQLD